MDTTEIYRRAIVLPLDNNALKDIEEDKINSDTNVLLIDLQEEDFFSMVWATGIFTGINQRYNIIIDDYEEECLEQTIGLSEFIKDFSHRIKDTSDINKFFQEFQNLAIEAEKRKSPIYFIF